MTRIASKPYGQDVWLDVQRLSEAWGLPPRVFFDVGANVGQTAIAIRARFPEARILSFEPHPQTYERLRAQVEGLGVETFGFAFGDARREGELHAYRFSELNSIVENAPYAVRFGETGTSLPVQIRTVGDFCAEAAIASIDVLKIDTEGYDLQVLHGARAMLAGHGVTFVYTEFNDVFEQRGAAGGALLPICDLLYPLGFRMIATYTDQVFPEEDLFVVANALFVDPAASSRRLAGLRRTSGAAGRRRQAAAGARRSPGGPSRRPDRRVGYLRRPSRGRSAGTAVAVLLALIAVFVGLPEAFGDRPYDPRPSRVFESLVPPRGDGAQLAARRRRSALARPRTSTAAAG